MGSAVQGIDNAISPITEKLGAINRKIDPVMRFGPIRDISEKAESHPLEAAAIAAAAYFTGGAALGALGGLGATAGATAGATGALAAGAEGAAVAGTAAAGASAAAGAGTAAAIGAGAADIGTAAGLGSGLLAGTSGTALGAGSLAATAGTTVGVGGGLSSLSAAALANAGAAGLAGSSMAAPGLTGVGNAIGASVGQGAGTVGTGFQGAMNGAAFYGDSGLTGTVGVGSNGLNAAMAGDMGNSLGTFNSTLGGLAPMGSDASGALGGGLSGAVNGSAGVGYGAGQTATMGGFANSPGLNSAMKALNVGTKATNMAKTANAAMQQPQQQQVARMPVSRRAAQGNAGGGIPAPLPMMTGAGGIIAMPGANQLPTSNSSYDALLNNMLANSAKSPMAGLGSGSNFVPGAGGTMNPGYLLPRMY